MKKKTPSAVSGIQGYAERCPLWIETGKTESPADSLPKCAATPAFSAFMPPTARTAKTASTMTAVILITNCTRSVQSTAQSPAATA